MRLELRLEALAEIESARIYLESRASGLGEVFIAEIETALIAITGDPESLPLLETAPARLGFRRYRLQKFSHVVVFEIIDDSVVVMAVAHESQRPNYWIVRRRSH